MTGSVFPVETPAVRPGSRARAEAAPRRPWRVLVVDDEAKIRQIVARYLAADHMDVVEAVDGAEALRRAAEAEPDVVILDLMLPDMDGIDVLRELRRRSDVFVIVLSARSEEVDRLVGLSVGADDYVVKPFSPRELVARVKAMSRRQRGGGGGAVGAADVLAFAGLSIDLARREVERDGEEVELTALEFDLLVALASSPARVFTRRQLLERVWGWDFFGDERIVDVHIRNLRRALKDDAASPRLIGTARGVGYKFIGSPT